MKKRARLTPFAKIVILAVIVLIARYAYLHRAEIASGEFFKFSDTVSVQQDTNFQAIDTINDATDSILITGINIEGQGIDTVTIIIEKNKGVLSIRTDKKSINILLSDSILVSDTILFNIPKGKESIGRIIIK